MDMEVYDYSNYEHGSDNSDVCESSVFSKMREFLQKPVVIKVTLVWCGAAAILIAGFMLGEIFKAITG